MKFATLAVVALFGNVVVAQDEEGGEEGVRRVRAPVDRTGRRLGQETERR